MKKLLFPLMLAAICAALIFTPAILTDNAQAEKQANEAVAKFAPVAPVVVATNSDRQRCGTKELDETVAIEIQSSLDEFNSKRDKGNIRKSAR